MSGSFLSTQYLNALTQADRLYHANWVVPYSNAYVEAHQNFKKTLDEQKAYDKMMADIALMALSLPIGAGMAALLAKSGAASAKSLALSKTVDVICNRNMTRTFNAISIVAASPAASFLAGKAWDEAESKITTATKAKVGQLLQPTPLATSTIKTPLQAKGNMERYAKLATAAAHEIAANLNTNAAVSAAKKNELAAKLMAAPLIKKMPYTANIPANAAKYMELNMYMALILESDVAKTTTGGAIWGGSSLKDTSAKTNVPPSDPRYPAPYNRNKTHGSGFSTSVSIDTRVIRVDLGHKIWTRINTLHKELFKTPFYSISALGVQGYTVVVLAEAMSEKIHKQIRGHL